MTLGTQTVFTQDFLSAFNYQQFVAPVVIPVAFDNLPQTLDFNFNTTTAVGALFLDDISMDVAVPEPGTMMASGARCALLPFGAGAIW